MQGSDGALFKGFGIELLCSRIPLPYQHYYRPSSRAGDVLDLRRTDYRIDASHKSPLGLGRRKFRRLGGGRSIAFRGRELVRSPCCFSRPFQFQQRSSSFISSLERPENDRKSPESFFGGLKGRPRSMKRMKPQEVFDLKEAAQYLGVPVLQMRTLAKQNRVTYCRVDRTHWRFARRDLDAYIARNTFRAKTLFETTQP
jgi:excisionase family DNA binding protein